MAWKVNFKRHESKDSNFAGDCSATFLNEEGEAVASYSAIIQSDDGVQDFVTKAKAAKDKAEAEAIKNSEIQTKIETILNS